MPKSKNGDIANAVATKPYLEKGIGIEQHRPDALPQTCSCLEQLCMLDSHKGSNLESNLPTVSHDMGIQQQIPSDEVMRWQMRWWLFRIGIIFSFVWMILMVGLSTYVFIRTGSVFSLFISAASAPAIEFIRRFANYLLPMDEKRYLLAIKKIEAKALKYANKKQRDESNTKRG